jgi:tight adherence protein B
VRARLLALALVAGIAAATASGASPATRPFSVTEAQAGFPDRAYVLSLPSRLQLSGKQVRVFENGQPVSGLSVVAEDQGTPLTRFGVVLLIDASQSMEGAPELSAFKAARAFAAQRQPHEQLAVMTYNVKPELVLPFTTDQAKIDAALSSQPPFQFGTHIYDAVLEALDQLKAAKITAGSIVVLSDGQEHRGHGDTGSHATEKAAAAAARAAHVRVFSVGLRSQFFRPKALRALSRHTGSEYTTAESLAQLSQIYKALGAKLAREYLVTYRSEANPGTRITVSFRVQGFPGIVTSGYVTPSPPGHHGKKPGPYHESFLHKLFTSPLMMIFIALISASLVALAVVAVASSWRGGTLRKRMAEFVSMPAPERERPSGVLAAGVEGGTEKILEGTRWWGRFTAMLELAGIATRPERIIVFTLIGTFLLIWILSVVLSSFLVAIVIGLLLPFAVRAFLKRKVDRKRKAFAEQLPDNLQVLASALRAGHSFIGALSVVVDDAPDPSRTEFRRVIADEQLGVPLEDALHVVVERMESRELEQVALVAAVQRQSGGNTAEVLDRVTDTIRERFELRRTVQTLTAQGRLSRWIVSFLPLFLLVVITIINPTYMHVLYSSTSGRIALAFAALMVVAGSLVIKRIINIKV